MTTVVCLRHTHSMLIYHSVKAQDMDALIVWPNDHDDIVVMRGWGVLESVEFTYRTLVEDGYLKETVNPELDATLVITQALEKGVHLMRIGFVPTPQMVEEIALNLLAGKIPIISDE